MTTSDNVAELLSSTKLIAILRKVPFAKMPKLGEALYRGGVRLVEVTMESENALEALSLMQELKLTPGAGTILDAETARLAVLHGAEFLVTPCLRKDVIATGRRYNVPVIAGTLTPTEILEAFEAGSSYVKVFPAGTMGPGYLKDVKGPLSHIPLVPSGGITLENAGEFIQSGALAVGVGSALTNRQMIAEDNFAGIERLAGEYLKAVSVQ